MEEIKGHLVLLMAPSGSGKNTIVQGLGDLRDKLYFAKTFTSRAKREGAEENPNYEFLTREAYEQLISDDAFIEWAEFSGNLYGTPKSEILDNLQKPQVVFKEMELQGVRQIKQLVPDDRMTVIYIDAGTWEELEERILSRAEIDPTELELRKQRYEEEVLFKEEAEIIISNRNGELEPAKDNFRTVIAGIVAELDT